MGSGHRETRTAAHEVRSMPLAASSRAEHRTPEPEPPAARTPARDRDHQHQRQPGMRERQRQPADDHGVFGDRGRPVADRLRRGVEQHARARSSARGWPAPRRRRSPACRRPGARRATSPPRRGTHPPAPAAACAAGPSPSPRPGSCRRRIPPAPARPTRRCTHGDCVTCSACGRSSQPSAPARPMPNTVR